MRTLFAALVALALVAPAEAQSVGETHLRRLLAVPLGALPPMGMLMPASRNHNYWVGRVQAGTQRGNLAGDYSAYAAGVDLQWAGGSTLGVTGGFQSGNCDPPITDCDHGLFGARARVNLLTGGPTVAALVGDNSATTTLGTELGYGYSPNAVDGRNACAVDIGLPVSLSLFQRFRMLTFFTPGVAWDVRCFTGGGTGTAASAFVGAGIGIQKLFHHGFDVSLGAQRIIRGGSGLQLGVSASFVWLR